MSDMKRRLQEQEGGGPLVEDTSVVGGTDKDTGAPVIKPKTPSGKADESVNPTDKREG